VAKKTETPIATENADGMSNPQEFGTFLTSVRDRMADGSAPPVYALTMLNRFMQSSNIYTLLTPENKELARDIWLRIKQAGFQVKHPPLLFSEDEAAAL
jgi:hypothetical protein